MFAPEPVTAYSPVRASYDAVPAWVGWPTSELRVNSPIADCATAVRAVAATTKVIAESCRTVVPSRFTELLLGAWGSAATDVERCQQAVGLSSEWVVSSE